MPITPPMELISTMRPPPCARMAGSTCWTTLLDDPHAAPEVGLQLRLRLPDRALLDRSGQPPPGAGDKRVDPPAAGQQARHARAY
jgi:hypothetical protein